jgi:hypothetical protein
VDDLDVRRLALGRAPRADVAGGRAEYLLPLGAPGAASHGLHAFHRAKDGREREYNPAVKVPRTFPPPLFHGTVQDR